MTNMEIEGFKLGYATGLQHAKLHKVAESMLPATVKAAGKSNVVRNLILALAGGAAAIPAADVGGKLLGETAKGEMLDKQRADQDIEHANKRAEKNVDKANREASMKNVMEGKPSPGSTDAVSGIDPRGDVAMHAAGKSLGKNLPISTYGIGLNAQTVAPKSLTDQAMDFAKEHKAEIGAGLGGAGLGYGGAKMMGMDTLPAVGTGAGTGAVAALVANLLKRKMA